MTLSEYFAARSGNQAALVRALGLPQTTVAHWASRSRAVPAEYVLSIESATKNAVSRKELLPNTWAAIWPELADAAPTTGADEPLRTRMLHLAQEVAGERMRAARVDAECARLRTLNREVLQKLDDAVERNHELERQVLALFGPAAPAPDAGQAPTEPVADASKTRGVTESAIDAALAEARQVFAGSQPSLDALAYVGGVLAASPAPAATLTSTAIFDLKLKVDTSELDAALALAEKLKEMMAVCAPAFAAANARIASAMSAAGEKAAAAMRAESAQLAADAERTTGQAGRTSIDPTGDLSREVRSLSDRLMVQRDLAAQLLILAELRGLRAEQASDRFASGAAVLS